ncbi:hypothetical protein [Actinomadura sp. 6N118]|uniref:hypothetical protein n=1 Tax=Actinomadura sp. 6N118 TaxID=3375151 RepID=UPI0037AADC27
MSGRDIRVYAVDQIPVDGETGGFLAKAGEVISEAVKYAVVVGQLTLAGAKLAMLSDTVRSTYRYIERCSRGVDRLAEQMAHLKVDVDTVAEHHDAAAVMRGCLADAEAMANTIDEMSIDFGQAAADHQAEYGSVAEAADNMPVQMAEAEFYSNR